MPTHGNSVLDPILMPELTPVVKLNRLDRRNEAITSRRITTPEWSPLAPEGRVVLWGRSPLAAQLAELAQKPRVWVGPVTCSSQLSVAETMECAREVDVTRGQEDQRSSAGASLPRRSEAAAMGMPLLGRMARVPRWFLAAWGDLWLTEFPGTQYCQQGGPFSGSASGGTAAPAGTLTVACVTLCKAMPRILMHKNWDAVGSSKPLSLW